MALLSRLIEVMLYSRGVERSDSLATGGDEFVVYEEAGGLPVAVPIGGDKVHKEIGHDLFLKD